MPSDLPLSPESAASDPQQSRLFQCAEALRSQLRVLIEPTQLAARTPFMKSLAPTAADYARVFVPAAVAKAQSYYEAMRQQPAQMVWDPYHTVLRLHVALPEDFLSAHPRARGFPGFRGRELSFCKRVIPMASPPTDWCGSMRDCCGFHVPTLR